MKQNLNVLLRNRCKKVLETKNILTERQCIKINEYIKQQLHKKMSPLMCSQRGQKLRAMRKTNESIKTKDQAKQTQNKKKINIHRQYKHKRTGSLDTLLKIQVKQNEQLKHQNNKIDRQFRSQSDRLSYIHDKVRNYLKNKKRTIQKSIRKNQQIKNSQDFGSKKVPFSFKGLYEQFNIDKITSYCQNRSEQNRYITQYNYKLNKETKDSDSDQIDKQFQQGLIQQIYSSERVKMRIKMNKKKWLQKQSYSNLLSEMFRHKI